MAMFSSADGGARSTEGRGAARDTSVSIIASGMQIVGDVTTDGIVKVEGAVKGSIRARRQIVVGEGGRVEGDLSSREVIVGGMVAGAICADERIEVQRGSTVNGDITAQRIGVQEGGEVNGHVRVGQPQETARGPQSQRTADPPAAPGSQVAPTGTDQ